MEQLRLLIIEDDDDQRELIRETLEDHFGRDRHRWWQPRRRRWSRTLAVLRSDSLPITIFRTAPGWNCWRLIRALHTPVIMVTGENVGQIAAEAIRKGATDYVVKFGDYLFTIPLVVEKNLTVAKVKRENEKLRGELERALGNCTKRMTNSRNRSSRSSRWPRPIR